VPSQQVIDDQRALDRMMTLIQQLDPFDRQVILLYLEVLAATSLADITGIAARNVATKVHRIKKMLAQRFQDGTP
jgi:RNA polymerase sigma-70 factor (ECF subfamily)